MAESGPSGKLGRIWGVGVGVAGYAEGAEDDASGEFDSSALPSAGLDREERFYYNAGWQLLERRTDPDLSGAFGHERTLQLIWGQRYIDELVGMVQDTDADGESDAQYLALTDRNFSVIGMADMNGQVLERTRYSPYGESVSSPWSKGDANGDGSIDLQDLNFVNGSFSSYKAEADFDADGVVGLGEFNTVLNNSGTTGGGKGAVSALGNIVGYDGYLFEPTIGMYCVRFRWYAPEDGRWLKRDPLGYVDGSNIYQHVKSNPARLQDPVGLNSDETPAETFRRQAQEIRRLQKSKNLCSDRSTCGDALLSAAALLSIVLSSPDTADLLASQIRAIIDDEKVGVAVDAISAGAALEELLDALDDIEGAIGKIFGPLEEGAEVLENVDKFTKHLGTASTAAELIDAIRKLRSSSDFEIEGHDELVGLSLIFGISSNFSPPLISEILTVYGEAIDVALSGIENISKANAQSNINALSLCQEPTKPGAPWGHHWIIKKLNEKAGKHPIFESIAENVKCKCNL